MKKTYRFFIVNFIFAVFLILSLTLNAFGLSDAYKDNIYNPGILKATDSKVKVKVGQKAPGFTLKAVSGEKVSLQDYFGKKNVVLTFVPAAWTPVCSDQWPGYNIVKDLFDETERHVPVVQVAHRVDEDGLGTFPAEREAEGVFVKGDFEAVTVMRVADGLEALGHALGVAMLAAGADLGTPRHGVPSCLGPFD